MPSIRPIVDQNLYENLTRRQKLAMGKILQSTTAQVLDIPPEDIEVIWFQFDGSCATNALAIAVDVLLKVTSENSHLVEPLCEALANVLRDAAGFPDQGGVFVFATEHAKFKLYTRY